LKTEKKICKENLRMHTEDSNDTRQRNKQIHQKAKPILSGLKQTAVPEIRKKLIFGECLTEEIKAAISS